MKVVHRNLKDRMLLTLLNDFRAVAGTVAEFPGRNSKLVDEMRQGLRVPFLSGTALLRKSMSVRNCS